MATMRSIGGLLVWGLLVAEATGCDLTKREQGSEPPASSEQHSDTMRSGGAVFWCHDEIISYYRERTLRDVEQMIEAGKMTEARNVLEDERSAFERCENRDTWRYEALWAQLLCREEKYGDAEDILFSLRLRNADLDLVRDASAFCRQMFLKTERAKEAAARKK